MDQPSTLVAVTGGAGFLGSEVLRQLRRESVEVRATDRVATLPSQGIEYVRADIRKRQELDAVVSGATCVIHAAGLAHVFRRPRASRADFDGINRVGTANVAAAAVRAGVRQFVLISSVSVYGENIAGPRDERAPARPAGPYAMSKWEAERQAADAVAGTGMSLTILRMATIYGEGDPGNVARLLSSIDRGRFLWVGDGDNRKSLIHREDAARACVRAALAGVQTSATFNVSAPPCTMREIVRTACELLGRRPPRLHIPGSLALPFARLGAAMTLGKWRIDDTLRKWLSDDVYPAGRIREALRFEASVSLSEGLGREVAWYRNKAR